jgi:hypothetical protein
LTIFENLLGGDFYSLFAFEKSILIWEGVLVAEMLRGECQGLNLYIYEEE